MSVRNTDHVQREHQKREMKKNKNIMPIRQTSALTSTHNRSADDPNPMNIQTRVILDTLLAAGTSFDEYDREHWHALDAMWKHVISPSSFPLPQQAAGCNREKYQRSMLKATFTPEKMRFCISPACSASSVKCDDRIHKMMRFLISWHRRFGKTQATSSGGILGGVDHSTLILYVNDTYLWEHPDLPTCVFAKPENRTRAGILFPDDHFFCNEMVIDKKDGGEKRHCLSPSDLAQFFRSECADKPLQKRLDKAYFRGANTGRDKWDVRGALERLFLGSEVVDVRLGPPRVSQRCYCRPKMLLNLPGNQPWSYRMRELMLTGSLVIDVTVNVSYDGGRSFNGCWNQWWTPALLPGRDYVELSMNWIAEDAKHNRLQYVQLQKALETLVRDVSARPDVYQKISESGTAKVRCVNEIAIDTYIAYCFLRASDPSIRLEPVDEVIKSSSKRKLG